MTATERILLTIFLILIAAIALRPSIRGNDGVSYYVYLSSIIRGGDLNFQDDYRAFDDLKQYPFRFSTYPVSKITGKPMNRYGIGAPLLWSPFVAATHLGMKIWRPDRADTMSRPYEWAVGVATVFWGSLGLGLLYCRLRRDWSVVPAFGALLGLICATPLGFYVYAHGSMAHGVEFFTSTLILLTFEKAWREDRLIWFAACGLCLGYIVMIRPQNATWPVIIGIAFLWKSISSLRSAERWGDNRWQEPARIFVLVGAAVVVFIPQLLVWQSLYGKFYSGPMVYHDGSTVYFTAWPKYLFHALFSEQGGVLAWHPIMAIGLAGLAPWVHRDRKLKPIAVMGLACFAGQAWLVGSFSSWSAGASFGNRFFISSLPWIAFGVAGWLAAPSRGSQWRRILFLIIMIVWNMGLLVQYAVELVSRDQSMPWLRVIRQNLVDVPRLIWHRLL